MEKRARHRPRRSYPEAERVIVECELIKCLHCDEVLAERKPWHMRKTVQTLQGPLYVAGKSKECTNGKCSHVGEHYYATGVLTISLPHSTYGLDVVAYIGWRHENEHRQLVEIQGELNAKGIAINERTVGKLYRQFLALLGAMKEQTAEKLAASAARHGGLIWAIDALQPDGNSGLLYVLYEALSGLPVSAIQLKSGGEDELVEWLKPYSELPLATLATLCDGEKAIIAALKASWPETPHQRCQLHFLNNLADPVLKVDSQLRKFMYDDLGRLPAVPEQMVSIAVPAESPKGTDAVPDQMASIAAESPKGTDAVPDQTVSIAAESPKGTDAVPDQTVSIAAEAPKGNDAAPSKKKRDTELMEIESQICAAVRDAVNKTSRKPFFCFWGGLAGYQQMEAIAHALTNLPQADAETAYLQRIAMQVNRVVEKNRTLANDLKQAHDQLKRIADCLRYPSAPATERSPELVEGTNTTPPATQQTSLPLNSQAIAQEMQGLMAHFQPNKRQPAQSALSTAWHRAWHAYGPDLLHCYDIPALPPDNLQMEALFGRLRRHQRRISGRKSTCELALFGHCQVLFLADSQEDLLQQMQRVPLAAYQQQRRRLAEAEKPRQFLHRLHRQPLATMQALLAQHNQRRQQLALTLNTCEPHDDATSQPLSQATAPAQPANLRPNQPAFIRKSIFHSQPDNGLSDPLPP